MNSDSHFYIGSTHNVCQDYTLSNGNNVVLSDGCSGSVLTDFGSRILCVTSMYQLQTLEPGQDFSVAACLLTARPSARLLNLPQHCLDATLLFISQNEKFITATAYGDGFIILKGKDQTLYCIRIDYLCDAIGKSFPYYINYMYDIKREEAWLKTKSHQCLNILKIFPDGTVKNIPVNDGTAFWVFEALTITIKDGFVEVSITKDQQKDFEFIAVSSDGLNTFYKKDNDTNVTISPETMIYKLLCFKNFNGQFVKRRMKRFEEQNQKDQIHHMDDISLGVLYLGESNECNH